jgi:hypothetical protein
VLALDNFLYSMCFIIFDQSYNTSVQPFLVA